MLSRAHGLDPDAQTILDVVEAAGLPPLSTLSVAEAREVVRTSLVSHRPPVPLARVEEHQIPAPAGPLRARVYSPTDAPSPLALFLHGGGWTLNDLDTHDDLCRKLAKRSGWTLASLDYRRAPEHRHPAQLEDAHVAYDWLVENATQLGADPTRRALIGESAGATTAACLSVRLRDLGAPTVTYQVLAYPATDQFDAWPSYRERGTGYILDRDLMRWYYDHFLPQDWRASDPTLFPLAAPDLSGLPPTLVLTAEFDPLRDEGVAYVERLRDAGVMVEHIHAADQMHGFLLLDSVVGRCAELLNQVGDGLARAARR